ncbi:ribonuclease domain-containing protein [Corynebacterium mayonis]|uniref:ribonuclease domain-containing protein n=1 Tax=Corynebacterium mayonis TaxID=3062461 RepID=UPI003140022C
MSETSPSRPHRLSILLVGLLAVGGSVFGSQHLRHDDTHDGVAPCQSIPAEAHQVIDAVQKGGPHKYPEDDSRFGNYENLLPPEKLGYYREYTVETPGVHHRGPRRIVTGGGADGRVDEWYYTDDHYETFCEVTR